MTRARLHRAIVLKSVDVGDADRFCILFTRERGRIAARANGARKLLSRFHALQPGRLLTVELTEHGSSHRITSVTHDITMPVSADITAFARSQQGLEILLSLLQDNDELPAVFDDAAHFLLLCHHDDTDPVPAFTVRVLSLLGMLPGTADDHRYARLGPEDRAAVTRCGSSVWHEHAGAADTETVRRFAQYVLQEHLSGPLKTDAAVRALRA